MSKHNKIITVNDMIINKIAKEQIKDFDKLVLIELQKKFNTTTEDPEELNKLLSESNLELCLKEIPRKQNKSKNNCKNSFITESTWVCTLRPKKQIEIIINNGKCRCCNCEQPTIVVATNFKTNGGNNE